MKGLNIVFLFTLYLLGNNETEAIVIRHDIDDAQYQALGDRYTSSVAYAGGCAATVISKYWLLTAAHCISGRESHFFSALHAENDYRIEKLFLHPKFRKTDNEKYDIALIQMKDPIKNITPVKLYKKDKEKGMEVIFIGRGAFGNGRDGLIRSDFIQRGATNTVLSVSDQTIEFRFNEPDKATSLEGISSRRDSGGPDINFDFNGEECVSNAYQYIQSLSSQLVGSNSYYWSKTKQAEIPILFGENPALKHIEGEAESFHVLFGGIKSNSGKRVPDLGVFVLSSDYISLDYKMGQCWNTEAVIGLFEIMAAFESLSKNTRISHEGNIFEQEGELISAYTSWRKI